MKNKLQHTRPAQFLTCAARLLRRCRFAAAALACAALPLAAHATDFAPAGVSLQAGGGHRDHTQHAAVGLLWKNPWQRDWWGGQASLMTEFQFANWRADGRNGGRESYTQAVLLPVVRTRGDAGRSRWFLEAGIGVSLMDNVYHTQRRQFSTAFNFVDVLGAGYSFGAQRQHELGLRLTHVSNANIKRPNPGEDSLQLRYARWF